MNNIFKTFLMLSAVVGLLAGCAATGTSEDQQQAERDAQAAAAEERRQAEAAERERLAQQENEQQEQAATTFYFGFDESTLRPDARAALRVHAEQLRQNPQQVRLVGHTDERGSREYNMALGERRANAVRDFLVLQGVDSSLIETVSYGEERPAVMGSYEGAWAQNRRVELKK
jgi:peptidoglycan-associated lipoprotein